MFDFKTVRDVNVQNQIVLVRADYNVPLEGQTIVDDLRIRANVPTLQYLLQQGAKKIIVISHLGRPEGADPSLSLRPIAERLGALMPGVPVGFVDDVAGPKVEQTVATMPDGAILVMENLRFYSGEKANSADFARDIATATGANVFVQDGFAVVHRAHASTVAITQEIFAVAGLLVEREVATLRKVTTDPVRPFYVFVGGAKVEDKAPMIEKLAKVADGVFVGGKIAADGYDAEDPEGKIQVAREFRTDLDGNKLDISEEAGEELAEVIQKRAATVLWNGTMGKTEDLEFARGSEALAEAIGTKEGLVSVICGGDTTGFVENLQKTHPDWKYTLVSTGGGASLALLSGEHLPGIEALQKK